MRPATRWREFRTRPRPDYPALAAASRFTSSWLSPHRDRIILKRIENSVQRSGIEIIGLAVIFTLMMIFRSEGLFGRWEIDELAVRWWRSVRGGRPPVREGGATTQTTEGS